MKKKLSFLLIFTLIVTLLVPSAAFAEDETAGTAGHVIINQVYGGKDDGAASHSFIELYNPTDQDADMSSWSLQYKSSADGKHNNQWYVQNLTGTIKSGGYYLIRCGATSGTSYAVPAGDQEWDIQLHNKGVSVALVSNQTQLTDAVRGDITKLDSEEAAGIVDMAAVQGNDKEDGQVPPAYEESYSAIQSKKKAIRRVNFADTNNNANDFVEVDYSKAVDDVTGPHGPAGDGMNTPEEPETPSYTPVETTAAVYNGFYNETADLAASLIARYNAGAMNADGGSAEIVVYNSVKKVAYAVNGVKGTLDQIPMNGLTSGDSVQNLEGIEIDVKSLVEGKDEAFTYGDMTSVAVSPDGTRVAVALQDADYTKTGRAVLFTYGEDGSLYFEKMAVTGVQPDMITFNEDGTLVLTANEGEPRNGYTASDAVDPAGSVSVITAADGSVVTAGFESFDNQRENLTAAGVVIKKGTNPSLDFEPEYITVVGSKVYVSLQEANSIAVLDLNTKAFTGVYSIGFEDYSKVAIDLNSKDEKYEASTYENIKGIRMPDAISSFTANGKTYLVTANEGDSRAWPVETEADVNEIKAKISPVSGQEFEGKVTWFDVSQYNGLEAGTDYLFGGRSFSVFEVTENGLEEVYESGSDFEKLTNDNLAANFNCSNDTAEVEDRSGKKGPEPEGITTGTVNGKTYAFIALERIGGIMMYDVTNPENTTFVNYINSRDFSEDIKNDVSPEGMAFVEAENSPTGKALLVVANEVSGTVSIYELTSNVKTDDKDDDSTTTTPSTPSTPSYTPSAPSTPSTPDSGDDADKDDDSTQNDNAKLIAKIEKARFAVKSKLTTLNGKKAVKVYWKEPKGVDLDGYQVFRSLKRYSGYTKKPFFTTEKTSYYNTKELKAGTCYYYKVRGFKEVDGKTVYTQWSYKAWRTV